MAEEEDSAQLKFEEVKVRIEDMHKNCENSQQRLSPLDALNKTLLEFSPVRVTEITIPKTVKTKERPKGTANGRLPSRFELAEKKEKKNMEKEVKEANAPKEKLKTQEAKKKAKVEIEVEVEEKNMFIHSLVKRSFVEYRDSEKEKKES
ncbi:hypothetical protein G6F56_007419 [Rhizopus delemar]|nr:hypothetical protein G6F56_007419 [Rhizopus delemar]